MVHLDVVDLALDRSRHDPVFKILLQVAEFRLQSTGQPHVGHVFVGQEGEPRPVILATGGTM